MSEARDELELRCDIDRQQTLLLVEADVLAKMIIERPNAYDVQVLTAARQIASRCSVLRSDRRALAVVVSGG